MSFQCYEIALLYCNTSKVQLTKNHAIFSKDNICNAGDTRIPLVDVKIFLLHTMGKTVKPHTMEKCMNSKRIVSFGQLLLFYISV